MQSYRIIKRIYNKTPFQGGSIFSGGRWNLKGTDALYTSESIPSALWEQFVYWDSPKALEFKLSLIIFKVPDEEIIDIPIDKLPDGWDGDKWIREAQVIGDVFLQSDILALRLPSALIPLSDTILIFPNSSRINKVTHSIDNKFEISQRIKNKMIFHFSS